MIEEQTKTKRKQYIRCRYCDLSFFIEDVITVSNSANMAKYKCPACGHIQLSRKFNVDPEDLPDGIWK